MRSFPVKVTYYRLIESEPNSGVFHLESAYDAETAGDALAEAVSRTHEIGLRHAVFPLDEAAPVIPASDPPAPEPAPANADYAEPSSETGYGHDQATDDHHEDDHHIDESGHE
ncbi:hypothetical protein GbCGDNIH4_7168 [Granulibacter bethesdensis CGDNIH4]|nr:hypothetical protein GbCGDNIH4_7168 [Granulibacter bethesdensis CGDNIH4]